MSSGLESELRAAFTEVSDFVQPPPDLPERVRRAARRHRQQLTASLAAATAVVVIAAGGFLATHDWHRAGTHTSPSATRDHGFSITFPDGYTARQLASSGSFLYALIGPPDGEGVTLAAYDRTTGRLVREVSVPGSGGSALAVGPGGMVWLSFTAGNSAGPIGTWLLSPDLRLHSGVGVGGAYVLLPVSRTAALVPDVLGLVVVRLPLPGRPGPSTARLEPGSSLGQSLNTAPGASAAMLGGRIVVQVTNGVGFDSRLVVAGHPRITFGGRASNQVGFVAQTGDSLWVATYAVHGQYANGSGQLVRVNSTLHPTTPEAVLDSSVLARTEDVWAAGDTVFAATAAPHHALVCFAAGGRIGAVTSLPAPGPVTALAASGGTVYVTSTPRDAASGTVTSYPIPAACR
jgi:hypothetical protein